MRLLCIDVRIYNMRLNLQEEFKKCPRINYWLTRLQRDRVRNAQRVRRNAQHMRELGGENDKATASNLERRADLHEDTLPVYLYENVRSDQMGFFTINPVYVDKDVDDKITIVDRVSVN